MTDLKELSTLFAGAYSLRFRPSHGSLHLDVPGLDNPGFSQINALVKTIATEAPITLSLDFKNEKYVSLVLTCQTHRIAIEKLRPMYGLKAKLLKMRPATVELCLFNYRYSGMYIGTPLLFELGE